MNDAVQKNHTPTTAWLTAALTAFKDANVSRHLVDQWRFLDVRPGEVVELQTLKPGVTDPTNEVDKYPKSRFAFATTLSECVQLAAEAESFQKPGVYLIQNRHKAAVKSKARAGVWYANTEATTDADISARRVIYLDFDPVRADGVGGISATDAEQRVAVHMAAQAITDLAGYVSLSSLGFCLSGNGAQVWLALADLANTAAVKDLMKEFLLVFAAKYGTDECKVDEAVVDAKRLAPLASTRKTKGQHSAERPHRLVRFYCSEVVERVTQDALVTAVAALRATLSEDQHVLLAAKLAGSKPTGAPAKPMATAADRDEAVGRARKEAMEVPIGLVLAELGMMQGANPVCVGCGKVDPGSVSIDTKRNALHCFKDDCAAGPKDWNTLQAVAAVQWGGDLKGKNFFKAIKWISDRFHTYPVPTRKAVTKGPMRLVAEDGIALDTDDIETDDAGDVLPSAPPDGTDWTALLTRSKQGENKGTAENVILILTHDPRWACTVAYNEFANRFVWLREPPWDEESQYSGFRREQELLDSDDTRLVAWLGRHYGIHVGNDCAARALAVVGERVKYHPVKEYLDGLQWDGTVRLANWLHDYLGVEPTAFSSAVGRKWMISAAARIYEPGCKADCALVLEGAQGAKKSTTFAVLGGAWFTDNVGDIGSKDFKQNLAGKWIVEWAELAGMSRAERNTCKREMSSPSDNYRASYGRRNRDYPRQNVFCGSTNDAEYLIDPTGNRRWWPVVVGRIDAERLRRDRDQLWAEAVALYQSGIPWWITDEEEEVLAQAKEIQDDKRVRHPWEDMLKVKLEHVHWVTTHELLESYLVQNMNDSRTVKAAQMQLSDVMKALNWTKARHNNERGYLRPGYRIVLPRDAQGTHKAGDIVEVATGLVVSTSVEALEPTISLDEV